MSKVEFLSSTNDVDFNIKIKPSKKKASKPRNYGKEFESKISAINKIYESENKAYIFKTFPEAIIIKNGSKIVTATYKDKAELDYFGILANGKTFTLEAKSSSGKSFPLSNIKSHQLETASKISKYVSYTLFIIEIIMRYIYCIERT